MNGHAMYAEVQRYGEDNLVSQHAALVKRIAFHLINRMPANVQVDDLIQAGMVGLLEAAGNFDAAQGASFETYAGIRIRGAMLDEIRKLDWTPRSVHRKARAVSDAMRKLEIELGHDPSDQEIAAEMGVSLSEYHQILVDSNSSRIFSTDALEEQGIGAEYARTVGINQDLVVFRQADPQLGGNLLIAWIVAQFDFEFAHRIADRTRFAVHRTGSPVQFADFVEHGTADADAGVGFETGALRRIEITGCLEQADHAGLD